MQNWKHVRKSALNHTKAGVWAAAIFKMCINLQFDVAYNLLTYVYKTWKITGASISTEKLTKTCGRA